MSDVMSATLEIMVTDERVNAVSLQEAMIYIQLESGQSVSQRQELERAASLLLHGIRQVDSHTAPEEGLKFGGSKAHRDLVVSLRVSAPQSGEWGQELLHS